jgi:hypothetical protein
MVEPEGKRPQGRPRRRRKVTPRMNLGEIGQEGADWLHLAQDRDQGPNDSSLLKKVSAAWSRLSKNRGHGCQIIVPIHEGIYMNIEEIGYNRTCISIYVHIHMNHCGSRIRFYTKASSIHLRSPQFISLKSILMLSSYLLLGLQLNVF